ncbi:hypothetical protein COZ61_01875 [Candidatus Berkelbacteria bacterium CG_4_8_14_3_um_filter_33_6]|uniref:SCP domain-containing protein n=1 Tax=Candidatus Berkelbacteria bacterium CG_4_10_14_0_2_um_filter_35_9_33_12 TaxID=1974499 RepID=A0A2M7W4T9_9BACT|nr:MAG: hypothetical protein COX10_01075 [Candidatus Berkelbacteria bacterium CG23_combo_of_CG06-09_8_20_14_all_33_15]PIS08472.1 MAG: hypothetical protein COT76_01270 [Candidatus Berkelbacteria bacterium CG10_big_fil_rev_8_21_14_0_10_33_10]PIX31046.1 MAG: hypothetical protein COZ61_01875 [Candidatus Berkelbacteria bacterium CG_4_8_14_3_um_filter_33_6]PJA20925.1 MAG: hypothetical protein COX60_00350 [Candidatus Berkelbacteria bacterium CG_4_10_14_0_2_um_filter_35_9_33_12]PJB51769.1 MAG: hypothet
MTNPIKKLKSVSINKIASVAVFILLILLISNYAYASSETNRVYKLVNNLRLEKGKELLVVNEKLEKAAYLRVQDMFSKQYFDHFVINGLSPWDAIKVSGYDYNFAGENLAIGFTNEDNAFNAWVKSPTHYQNMLDSDYQEIGIAVVNGTMKGESKTLIVQLFASDGSKTKGAKSNNNQLNKVVGWIKSLFK